MKPSHFTVPRTLGECHFAANADPIERPPVRRMDAQDKLVLWACAIAVLALMVLA